eukprot:m51a1_g9673 hypothetical protein (167) ;mRNA; r:1269122-1269682
MESRAKAKRTLDTRAQAAPPSHKRPRLPSSPQQRPPSAAELCTTPQRQQQQQGEVDEDVSATATAMAAPSSSSDVFADSVRAQWQAAVCSCGDLLTRTSERMQAAVEQFHERVRAVVGDEQAGIEAALREAAQQTAHARALHDSIKRIVQSVGALQSAVSSVAKST